jgi:hypothetical protein
MDGCCLRHWQSLFLENWLWGLEQASKIDTRMPHGSAYFHGHFRKTRRTIARSSHWVRNRAAIFRDAGTPAVFVFS